jgi:uncharacterized protein
MYIVFMPRKRQESIEMKKLIQLVVGLMLLTVSTGILSAQDLAASWAGEWGEHRVNKEKGEETLRELSISDCFHTQCTIFNLLNRTEMSKKESQRRECGTVNDKMVLEIESPAKAVTHLRSNKSEQCTLVLERTGTENSSITITQGTGDCSYFCTANGNFTGIYPLFSKSPFYGILSMIPAFGDDFDFCFVEVTPASKALCGSKKLSDEEHLWAYRFDEVRTLYRDMDRQTELRKLVSSCDAAAEPSICLTGAFNRSTEKLNTTMSNFQEKETQSGDPEDAKRKIAALVGSYTHRFRNGDTSGDKYWSTNTLDIEKASDDSIHYSVDLYFYNGHTCSMQGEASYTRSGNFVAKVQHDEGKMCYFELIPTAVGIKLGDPTEKCRETTCGNRGTYNNAFFSFKRRTPLKAKIKLDDDGDNP